MRTRLLTGVFVFMIIILGIMGFIAVSKPPLTEMVYQMPEAGLTVIKSPEQTTAMTHPDFIKPVYEPIIPEGENIALLGKASASSFNQSYNARKAIDGKVNGASYWEAAAESYPNEITVDLGRTATVHTVKLRLNPESIWGVRTERVTLIGGSTEDDRTIIIPVADYTFDPDFGNEVVLAFEPCQLQFITLVIDSNSGAAGGQLAEIEIYE